VTPRIATPFVLGLVLGIMGPQAPALAHRGPPYPILVDQRVGIYTVSVWGDPDVGVGTFFVVFDPDVFRSASDPRITIAAWPSSGRLPQVRVVASRQRDRGYRAEIPFDREEPWTMRLEIEGSGGSAAAPFEVAVTPPGYGAWDLLLYSIPFLLVGGLWAAVAMRRRALSAPRRAVDASRGEV
jgi:hypothetical protein